MKPVIRLAASSLVAAALGACVAFDTPDTYNRHRYSVNGEFPEDSAAAEAQRLQWLDDWLQLRQMCPAGHEVLKRRKFDDLEDNPAHRALRYEVRCKPVESGAAQK